MQIIAVLGMDPPLLRLWKASSADLYAVVQISDLGKPVNLKSELSMSH